MKLALFVLISWVVRRVEGRGGEAEEEEGGPESPSCCSESSVARTSTAHCELRLGGGAVA